MGDTVVAVPQNPADGQPRNMMGSNVHESVPWGNKHQPGYLVALTRAGRRRNAGTQRLADEQQGSTVQLVGAHDSLFGIIDQIALAQLALARAIARVLGKNYSQAEFC